MVLELICASILIAVLFMVSKKINCCDKFFCNKNSCVFFQGSSTAFAKEITKEEDEKSKGPPPPQKSK